MAVYDGVPSIRLEGDEARALALIPEAKALLYTVQTFLQRAGVGTFSMTRRIGDDSYIYVLCAAGQNILHISVAPEVPGKINIPEPEYQVALSPDFYSGLVYKGFIEDRVADNADGTKTSYKVCAKFSPTPSCERLHKELKMGRQDVTRLSVRPWVAFDELNAPSGSLREFSQYTQLRASMYSGKMKKVVQVAMGLGRLGKAKLRMSTRNTPDSKYVNDVGENGVQIRYDWRYVRTHGIVTADDGRLWLVEISLTNGVLARPLPMIPRTTSEGFRESALNGDDPAMAEAIEQLGGLPTGEAFPVADELKKAIADGSIKRLLTASEIHPFYQCSPYSSAMGWAFNEKGNEAHNTGYYFGDEGFQRGVWYQVNFKISAPNNKGEVVATAELRKNSEGYIYCPPAGTGNRYIRYVPIKFHEPMLPGLMSHEGTPSVESMGLEVPKCDTVMFVSFIDEELQAVRYYLNPKSDTYNNIDDPRYPGECILAGSWEITEVSGTRSFPRMMYSNRFDDRRVTQEHVKNTLITSEDKGYDPPMFSDFLESPETCYAWRMRVFKRTTVISEYGGEQLLSAVAIPAYSREAYYYATGSQYDIDVRGSTSVVFDQVKDPNSGYGWRCFPRINPPPFPPDRPDCNTEVCRGTAPCSHGGTGFPKERRIVCLTYDPDFGGPWVVGSGGNTCYEFADSGPWLEICEIVDNFNQPGMNKTGSYTDWNKGRLDKASVKLMSPGYGGPISIPATFSQVENHWMTPSPDPVIGNVQFIYAEHSAIGLDSIVYATGLSSYLNENKMYGYIPDTIQQTDGFPAFIGVNVP